MEDLLDDAADIATTLSVVNGSELDRALSGADMGLEDGGLTLPLRLSIFQDFRIHMVILTIIR